MDLISRQAAIDAYGDWYVEEGPEEGFIGTVKQLLERLPSAQPERDIPMKPMETTDRTWVIPIRQAICPKCDYYLSNVVFIGDGKGKRVTYCEHCGQAIDWEGWDVDERSD